MASFLKKLFGGGPDDGSAEGPGFDAVEHNGVLIIPAPRKDNGQWRLSGILREAEGEHRERPFIRADMFPDAETAAEVAVRKGRLIIDQRGASLFSGDETGPV